MIRKLDIDDAKKFWNQILWEHTQKESPSNFEHITTSNKRDSIQIMYPTRVYHFDDINICCIQNSNGDFIQWIKKLPIIFNHAIFNLNKMPKGKLKARATHFHELQKMDGAYYEHKRKLRLNVEERNKFGSQKHAKVDVIRIQ